ncbi:MAG TPA: hypothetical protein VF376_09060, partial [Thermoanaerobaculia bacterium]
AAFDSKGHVVIEALAYRTLIEGRDGQRPQPEVLRDLLNDGAIAPPLCFDWGGHPPGYCVDAATSNPLLEWPKPLTDQPDAAFRRQFSDAGQCFHFMAKLEDSESAEINGTEIPRALATSALVRCRDLLDVLLRQVVIDGGPGTRRSGYGLYELMHSIGDSFSGAHTQRRTGTHEIEELRVWKPLTRLPGLTTQAQARIPKSAFHGWNDHRDKTYIVKDRVTAEGRQCKELVNDPYTVPYECLSEEGDLARQAIVELLVVVRQLRVGQVAGSGAGIPEQSDAWRTFKDKWFSPAYACSGEECSERQPADLAPGAYAFLGLTTQYNTTRKFFEVAAEGTLLKYSSNLNPFVYGLSANVGYRHNNIGESQGVAGLRLDLILPLGKRAALGFSPMGWRVAFGGDKDASELTTSFFRFDYLVSDRWSLTMTGPLDVNWRKPDVEWSFGLGLKYAFTSTKLAGGPLIQKHEEKVDRRDETWSPPAAPYGRLLGRSASWYAATGATTVETPANSIEGRQYGGGSLGAEVMWDRDRWGGRFAWAPAASLAIGERNTSGESSYLTGVFALGVRWYVLRVIGLSLTPVRIEGGPKIHGKDEPDSSADVHGSPGSQYYFQPGTRAGIAFNAGIIDILVEAPTLAWQSSPSKRGEILSIHLGIRLN